MLPACIRRLRPDVFVTALASTVALATLLPCQGISAQIFHAAGIGAIATLFFLQGARLSREAIVAGMTNWKLHGAYRRHDVCAVSPGGIRARRADAARAGPHIDTRGSVPVRAAIHRAVVDRADLDRAGQCGRRRVRRDSIQPDRPGADAAAVRVSCRMCAAAASTYRVCGRCSPSCCCRSSSAICCGRGSVPGPLATSHCWRSPTAARSCWSSTLRSARRWCTASGTSCRRRCSGALTIIVAGLLAAALLITRAGARACGFMHADEVAAVFCGSQKSLVAGIPIASVLFAGPTLGVVVLPIMLYHPMQLVVCAWLARRYANCPEAASVMGGNPLLPVGVVARQETAA